MEKQEFQEKKLYEAALQDLILIIYATFSQENVKRIQDPMKNLNSLLIK